MLRIGQSRWIRKNQTRARWSCGSGGLNTHQRLQLHIHIADRRLNATRRLRSLLNLVDHALE